MEDRVHSGSPFETRFGFCRARRVGARVEVAGTAPVPAPGEELSSTPYGQMMRCGQIAIEALEALGANPTDVVRTRMFITDPTHQDEVGRAHHDLFAAAEPVATMVVAQLLDPGWLVELEVEAHVTG